MSDVRVQIRFRNDLLQQLLDDAPIPVYRISEEVGVHYSWLMGVKALNRSPWGKDGTYSESSVNLAGYFHLSPEVLFPSELYRIKWPSKLEKRFPVERIASLIESDNQRLRALSPHEIAETEEMKSIVGEVLESLTPRERRVIEMRFGLGDESWHSYEEVGQDFEVTRGRIRQIEAKALRKLRDPRLSKQLRAVMK